MRDGTAEDQRPGAGVLLPRSPGVLEALIGVDGTLELDRIESTIAEGDELVISLVLEAIISERDQQPPIDTDAEIRAVGDVIVE